jgi:hypothetical protein
MALKKKIDKETFEKLSKDVQSNYTANGDHYLLDLEGDDTAELRRAKDREAADAVQLRKEKKELEDRLKALDTGDGNENKDKDIEKLTKAFDKKLEKLREENAAAVRERDDRLAARDAQTKKSMIDAAAMSIAAKISTSPKLLARELAERFDVDLEGDTPKLVILGTDGKVSSMTAEQLSKEFVANKEYAAIMIGSKASGSGAPLNKDTSRNRPSGASNSGDQAPDLSKMPFKDLAAIIKERKESQQR